MGRPCRKSALIRYIKQCLTGADRALRATAGLNLSRFLGVRVMLKIAARSRVGQGMLVRAALGVGLAAIVLCATSAARAGDDDEDGTSALGKILQGIGLQNPNAHYDGIDYNERSPLV